MRALSAAGVVLLLAGCLDTASAPDVGPLGRIDGAVVDGTLHPYAFQNVTLVNLNRVDQTSALGGFSFVDVPPGTYTLVAQRPGTDGDVKVVEVQTGRTVRVILQLLPRQEPAPFVESLKNRAHTDLAMPGQPCADCSWGTYVLEPPKEMVLRSEWDAAPVGDDSLRLRLMAQDGTLLGEAVGSSPLELAVRGDLPSQQRVGVQVEFGEGFTPRPLQISFRLDLYYGAERAEQVAASA